MYRADLWHTRFVFEWLTNTVDKRWDHFRPVVMVRHDALQRAPEDNAGMPNFVACTEWKFSNAIQFDRISNRIPPNAYRIAACYCRPSLLFHYPSLCCATSNVRLSSVLSPTFPAMALPKSSFSICYQSYRLTAVPLLVVAAVPIAVAAAAVETDDHHPMHRQLHFGVSMIAESPMQVAVGPVAAIVVASLAIFPLLDLRFPLPVACHAVDSFLTEFEWAIFVETDRVAGFMIECLMLSLC